MIARMLADSTVSPEHYTKPFELDADFVAAVVDALRQLRPEDAALLRDLDFTTDSAARVLSVRRARRLGGLLHYVDTRALLEGVQKASSFSEVKWLSTQIGALKKRFAECGLHAWGVHIERTVPAQPVVKKPSKLSQLEAENARLRALLAAHGIDTD